MALRWIHPITSAYMLEARVHAAFSGKPGYHTDYEWVDLEHISPNAIEVHISRLRAKLEPSGIRIRTIRGLGYLVEAWRDAEP